MTSPWQRCKRVTPWTTYTTLDSSTAMVGSGSQAFFKLGELLFAFSGIPVAQNVSKKQLLFCVLCVCIFLAVHLHSLYVSVSEVFGTDEFVSKSMILISSSFSFGSVVTLLKLFILRNYLKKQFFLSNNIVEMVKSEECGRRNTSIFLLRLSVAALVISCIVMDSSTLIVKMQKQDYFDYLLILIYIFSYLNYWALVYNVVMGLIIVVEIDDWLVRNMIRHQHVVYNLNTVLPVVDEDGPFCVSMAHPTQGRTQSSYRCSPWYINYCHYRKLKRLFSQVQHFRLRMNQLYYIPVAIMSFSNACFLPIQFTIPYFVEGTNYTGMTTIKVSLFVGTVYAVAIFMPYFLKQLVKYRDSYLSVTINKKAYMISDVRTKKVMLNFSGCIKCRYSESPCCFFEIDSEVLSLIIETAVLIATTFFVKKSS